MTETDAFILLATYGLTWMVAAMHDRWCERVARYEGRRVDEEWARLCEAVDVTSGGEGA